MKSLIAALLLLFCATIAISQDSSLQLPAAAAVQSDSIPNELCATVKDTVICVPLADAKNLGKIISDFLKENEGNWPTSTMGWIMLIIGLITSGVATSFSSNATKIYYFLKVFLRNTLHVVYFLAGVFSALVTFLVGLTSDTVEVFSWNLFTTIWPLSIVVAIYIYDRFIKKSASAKA